MYGKYYRSNIRYSDNQKEMMKSIGDAIAAQAAVNWEKAQVYAAKKRIQSIRSKVMTIANKLTAQGQNRSNAMRKAWSLVKMGTVETKVAGVTFGNRQKAVEHLTRYAPEDILIRLQLQKDNEQDANAVAVVATVLNKGSYIMGYLPRSLSAFVAPLMDSGKKVPAAYKYAWAEVPYMNFGMKIEVRI